MIVCGFHAQLLVVCDSELAGTLCDSGESGVRIMVCNDGVVYADRVQTLCQGRDPEQESDTSQQSWTYSLLLIVPLRLGLGKVVDKVYVPGLLRLFQLPQSVGCIGGTPHRSLYFVGAKGTVVREYPAAAGPRLTKIPSGARYRACIPRPAPFSRMRPVDGIA